MWCIVNTYLFQLTYVFTVELYRHLFFWSVFILCTFVYEYNYSYKNPYLQLCKVSIYYSREMLTKIRTATNLCISHFYELYNLYFWRWKNICVSFYFFCNYVKKYVSTIIVFSGQPADSVANRYAFIKYRVAVYVSN